MKNKLVQGISVSLFVSGVIATSTLAIAASAPSARKAPPSINLDGGGLSITSADGQRSFNVHGLIIVNHSAFDEAYNVDSGGEGHFGQETELQTVRLGINGKASKNWGYALQFANRTGENGENNDDAYIRRAYVTYQGWRFAKLTVGEQGANFGVDNMPDPNQTYGTTYTMLSNVFSPPSGLGVNLDGHSNEADFIWSAGVFHTGNVQREAGGDFLNRHAYQDETDMVAARVGWTPYYNEQTNNLLFVQASGVFVEGNDEPVAPIDINAGVLGTTRNSPVSSAGPVGFVGNYGNHEIYDIGLAAASGPFSIEAEYASLEQDLEKSIDDPSYEGAYIQAGWVVTGEHRNFNKEYGVLGGVNPQGRYGAVELNARIGYVDLRSNTGIGGAEVGNDATTYTLGANWYVNDHARLGVDVVYLDLGGPAALENHGVGGVVQASYAF